MISQNTELSLNENNKYHAYKLPECSSVVEPNSPSHPEMVLPNSDIFCLNKEAHQVMFRANNKCYSRRLIETPSKYLDVVDINAPLFADVHKKQNLGRENYKLSKTLCEL